jgi:DNA-binding CsgD family transcriptional regulator
MRRAYSFDLAAVFLHRDDSAPRVLFEELGSAGGSIGVSNYVHRTWRINPLLRSAPREGLLRARDFGGRRMRLGVPDRDYVVEAPDEEMGFRTIGWPPRLEEVALHFDAWGGRVELGLYRARSRCDSRRPSAQEVLAPIRSAFERHHRLTAGTASARASLDALSDREREVCALLLGGCSSEAVALRLGVSRHTVKDHRKNIYRKLNISSLAELFSLAGPRPMGHC